ncbi:MAG: NADH-ubiquinone oxidoreductase-F iron-sulfur binding region domain-containing protein, partial [bacterium]
ILTEPQHAFYHRVTPENVSRIIDAVIAGEYVEELLYTDSKTGEKYHRQDDIPFFKKQQRTIFSANQKIDPIRIYDYMENGGYSALEKALSGLTPGKVVEEVKVSGLRGRGGAGFPTGIKWELLAKQPGDRGKYIVCNADEGDPGAYMDRSLLEGNPHSVIEGMIIGAYATGATDGVVYVRNEYPLAIKHLVIALNQARDLGLIGDDILGTGFCFDIKIVRGAGAFVCGEETALMRSVEGKMGEPRQRPPYPVQSGIEGKPTVINNVETWANIPIIIRKGADEYAKIGVKGSSGTKIFSLVGKIKNTGLVEVPMGITLREIIYDIGGGPVGDAKIKAVQTGGPSGGCIPASLFDLSIDYDSLSKAGSIMGSGGMIVMDENTCMVDVAKYFMKFLKDESCGKCFTCRKGTQRLYELLEDITDGRGTLKHLDLLEELALVVKDTTMCGLGQSAPNPVLSTLKYFRDEYIEHIWDKKCRAGVCTKLTGAPCQAACPLGTEPWRYVALLEKGDYNEAYRVIRDTNPFPSVCARVCNHPCESKCRLKTTGDEAIAIRTLKRFITDNADPSIYKPEIVKSRKAMPKVAVVGSGPAGLTSAHYLSLKGYKVNVFEAAKKPGGMLLNCIPDYRLPQKVLEKEVDSLLNENFTIECNKAMGKDFTVDDLFNDGYKAVFLAIGAHKSMTLGIDGENVEGVFPSMKFLKTSGNSIEGLAKGTVGVIGGGNSALDAARVALRQKGVESVTIFYRRTRTEMPAFEEEIEAAIEEGVKLITLVTPVEIVSEKGKLTGLKVIENSLGDFDSSGRRKPVPIPGSERIIPLDTLIVAISETPESECLVDTGIELNSNGTLKADRETLCTSREGVFGGGDLITGPNTVVDAIAAGKRAALMIDRFLSGENLKQPSEAILPSVYIESREIPEDETESAARIHQPTIPLSKRRNFAEVELSISEEDAKREARRCLRCDLEFTESCDAKEECLAVKEQAI